MKFFIKTAPLSYLLLIYFLFSSTAIYSQQQAISAPQAYQNYYNKFGYIWIDLRSSKDVQLYGIIPKSRNIEYDNYNNFRTRLQRSDLNKNGYYVLYDTSGGRVKSILPEMALLGYKNVYYIQGGFNIWKQYKYPIEGVQPPQQQNIISATLAYNTYYNKFGTVWIDLRNTASIQAYGRIPKSVNVEYSTFGEFATRLQRSGLDKNGRYVLYDTSGGMIKTIISQMRQLGYSNAFYIQGGFNEWKRYKYPTEVGFGGGGEHGGNWSNIPPIGITDIDALLAVKYANSPQVVWLDFRKHKSPINNLSNLNSKINSANPLVFRALIDKLDRNASYIFFTDRGNRNSYLRKVFNQKNFRSVKSVHGGYHRLIQYLSSQERR